MLINPGAAQGYDKRGNLTADDAGNALSWDFDNRLKSQVVTETGDAVSYLYDVFGRRVARITGATTTVYVNSGEEPIAEYDNGALRAKYVLGGMVDRPVALIAVGTTYWYSSNHIGSIAALTDGSGAVVERYRYDAYGARTILSASGAVLAESSVGNATGFTGRYHDAASGLVDFRFRQYHPRYGRFISRDSAYSDGMLLYGAYFVPNTTDSTGHFTDTIDTHGNVHWGSTSVTVDGFRSDHFCFHANGSSVDHVEFSGDTRIVWGVEWAIANDTCVVDDGYGRGGGVIVVTGGGGSGGRTWTPPTTGTGTGTSGGMGTGGGMTGGTVGSGTGMPAPGTGVGMAGSGTGTGMSGGGSGSASPLSVKESQLMHQAFPDSATGRQAAAGKGISLYRNYTVHGGEYGGKEWVGLLYRQGGSIFSTRGYLGEEKSADLYAPLSDVPDGATVVGYWHTHPTMDQLSSLDVTNVAQRYISPCSPNVQGAAGCPGPSDLGQRTIRLEGGYVAGPSGRVWGYEPASVDQARHDLMGSGATQTPVGQVNPW